MIKGCSSIIAVLLTLGLVILFTAGFLVLVDVILLVFFIWSFSTWYKLKKVGPSVMKCSNCGSTNVKLSTRQAGISSTGYSWGYFGRGRMSMDYDRIAVCQDCGFTWVYFTAGEILAAQKSARNRMLIFGIVLGVCVALTVMMWAGIL